MYSNISVEVGAPVESIATRMKTRTHTWLKGGGTNPARGLLFVLLSPSAPACKPSGQTLEVVIA